MSVRYGSFSSELPDGDTIQTTSISPRRSYIAVAVLCYINLLNYMDRYTIAGVLLSIQKYFGISDSTSGLLQTVFICSFMFLAPVFGYLGDRYDRKLIMIAGLFVWIVTTLGSSFVKQSHFWVLVLTRALVGTGEASYSTIAPTIIGDLFTGTQRTLMISFFYIFIPVGSGLGYILGATIANATGDWRWALRVNPALGVLGLLLLVFLIPNPPRGASDSHGAAMERTSYLEDIKYLLKNRSFVWSSLGVTAMAFVTGALAFWTPTFLSRAQVTQGLRPPCEVEPCNPIDSYIFGAITVVTGIVGVFLGTFISKKLRDRVPNADPLICAVGMLSSSPCFFIAIILASTSIPATYTFIAIGETLLSLNWAILADILLYVVVPTRRATAEALQIMVCHLLGDAGSPYLIGAISDALRKYNPDSPSWDFRRLEYSVLLCPFAGVLGGLFFLMTSLYIKEDQKAAELLMSGHANGQPATSTVSV
ncbi:protein spinster homolog 3-like [Xyrauchen texanus]|uniref:protein spinster homolog 3-like n=1 Tax=Xyrauchen texanus TaxID=154827 RepID=UPI002241F975|nr:protein spinster homolog 3-like [Xyrauchen texanus]